MTILSPKQAYLFLKPPKKFIHLTVTTSDYYGIIKGQSFYFSQNVAKNPLLIKLKQVLQKIALLIK